MNRDITTPLVSIAIPFHNSRKFLRFSIQSVLNQAYNNWELFIIDDGSKDDSLELAKSYEGNRVTVISDKQNKGLAARLNESIQMASGKYYARMDDDDIMHFDRIGRQVEYMESHPDVDVLGTGCYIIDGNNNVKRKRVNHGNSSFYHPSIMGKTDWFKNNPYDEKLKRCQDKDLWYRTAKFSTFKNIDDCYLFYREEGTPQFKRFCKSSFYELSFIYTLKNKYGFSIFFILKQKIIISIKLLLFSILSAAKLNSLAFKYRTSEKMDPSERVIVNDDLKISILDRKMS